MSVLEGPHRLVLAAVAACALAVAMGAAGAVLGMSPKILDIAGAIFFAVLIVLAATLDQSGRQWLELWSGDISNAMIALVALGSVVLGTPFTIQYARQDVPREHWRSALFLRINQRITLVWTAAFALTAIVGYLGDGVLHQPDNIWTNWVVQVGAIVLALRFTDWYPDYASARAESPDAAAPAREVAVTLLRPLAAYIVPVGIVLLVFTHDPWWIGCGLIAVGVLCERRLRDAPRPTAPADGAEAVATVIDSDRVPPAPLV